MSLNEKFDWFDVIRFIGWYFLHNDQSPLTEALESLKTKGRNKPDFKTNP